MTVELLEKGMALERQISLYTKEPPPDDKWISIHPSDPWYNEIKELVAKRKGDHVELLKKQLAEL